VWRRGEEVFAEVALPDGHDQQADRFGLHPALFDPALQAMGFAQFAEPGAAAGPGSALLPFASQGVPLLAAGAPALRVRIAAPGPSALTVHAADAAGPPLPFLDSPARPPALAPQLAPSRAPA
ncbi:hypothetical protein VM98_34630, partial [Streptomyces rubellomurinus subsp. indigoferus]